MTQHAQPPAEGGTPLNAYQDHQPAQGYASNRPVLAAVDGRSHHGPHLGPVAAPPREAWSTARRVDAVPGTPFGVVYLEVPPTTSGPAVGSLVAGIAAVAVSLLVACFGLTGAEQGWGGWVAGAFAVLSALLGVAAIALGVFGLRQIRRPAPAPPQAVRFAGRGLAVAGVSCGAAGLGLTIAGLALALLLQLG